MVCLLVVDLITLLKMTHRNQYKNLPVPIQFYGYEVISMDAPTDTSTGYRHP